MDEPDAGVHTDEKGTYTWEADPAKPMVRGYRRGFHKRYGGHPNTTCQKGNAEGKCVIGNTEQKKDPPAWHAWAHVALGAASLVPGLNFVSTTGDVLLYAYDGEYGEAAGAMIGYIPGGEEARAVVKGGEALNDAAKAERAAKELKAAKEAKEAKEARKAKEAEDAEKAKKDKDGESHKKDKKDEKADPRCVQCG